MPAARVTSGIASRVGAAVAGVLSLLLLLPAADVRATADTVDHVAPGVDVLVRRADGMVINVARVAAGAPVQVKAALAGDRIVADGRESTSAMCRREAATICVNAVFAACQGCREVFGGFARDGIVRRSFHTHHDQFSVTSTGFSSTRPAWHGELRATLRWPAEEPAAPDPVAPPPPPSTPREETYRLPLDALNRAVDTGAVVVTADWGRPTTPIEGRRELVLAIDADIPSGAHAAQLLELRDAGTVSNGQAVVRTDADRATAFWDTWTTASAPERELVLETVPEPVLESVGAHPVLLRDGQRAPLDKSDGKVVNRHPRTLVGWTADGSLLLVTIDGRQAGWSKGATLDEATDVLLALGASDGLNLDGGGSSTFAVSCDGEMCVRNRPSDGGERLVPAVLAVVVDEGMVVREPARAPRPSAAAPTSAPPPPPAPSVAATPATAPEPPRSSPQPPPPVPPPPPAEPDPPVPSDDATRPAEPAPADLAGAEAGVPRPEPAPALAEPAPATPHARTASSAAFPGEDVGGPMRRSTRTAAVPATAGVVSVGAAALRALRRRRAYAGRGNDERPRHRPR